MLTGDPRLDKPLAALEALCKTAGDYNAACVSRNGGHATGKPEGRSPGMQNAEDLVEEMEKLLTKAVEKAERAVNNARVREQSAGARAVSFGGIPVGQAPEGAPVSPPYKRHVSVDVTTRRLVAKYAESDTPLRT